ncbi:OLC1v1032958C1 [Oldenlandia corymbosa var. corymbosa]|uniref:OLC1v1032958C1 n=1 Tax=Oldenlandia corymbosa var. corymbosa TaxID=529605 RepID=A0AAV1CQ74_OLDCO|nr:OLC1v1032958C1 [Oldenlandia corymbosa var. corymbosa]
MDSKYSAGTTPTSYAGTTTTTTGIPVNSTSESYFSGTTTEESFPAKPKVLVPWSTGLFDCFSDVSNCCITCWCPCITFGQISEIVDKGSSSCGSNGALYTLIACVTGCSCFYSCFYRSKMRQQYSLQEDPCNDCFVHCCCEACALCQEYRELRNRGYDMQIGWHGNMERQNKGVAMAPVVEGGMSR